MAGASKNSRTLAATTLNYWPKKKRRGKSPPRSKVLAAKLLRSFPLPPLRTQTPSATPAHKLLKRKNEVLKSKKNLKL